MAACGLVLTGTACGTEPGPTGAACLPEAARRWVAAPAAAVATPAGGRVDVYVDASGSMVGYLRGAKAERRPLQDLLAQLRVATMSGSATVERRYHLFGRAIQPLAAARVDELVREDTYRCPAGTAAEDCNNQESRLDLVLRTIADGKDPNTLSVIVTDLWLSSSDLGASGPVAVGAPAAELLAAGRSLGIIGVRAPYDGQVYDLPSGGSASLQGERPLFVLLAGPTERVTAFRDSLARAGVNGFGVREARFSLFTSEPSQAAAVGRPALAGSALTVQTVLDPKAGVDLAQGAVSARAAIRERIGGGGGSALTFAADPGAGMRPGAVWRGETEGVTKVWRLRGNPCRPGGWAPLADLPGGWSSGGGEQRYTLSAADAAARLPKGGDYLLAAELRRTGLETPNPANRWMREWSFNASSEPAVLASRPALFPTLNLGETAQVLEAAAEESARRRPVTLSGFAAVLRSSD